jgi:cyanophycin synthetase
MISKIQILGPRYLRGASNGLAQKTARVTLHLMGDLQAWRAGVELPDVMHRNLAHVLPTQAIAPDFTAQLLVQMLQPAKPERAFANAVLNLCLAIQREAHDAVWMGRVVRAQAAEPHHEVHLALPYEREAVLKDALQWAAHWCMYWGRTDASMDASLVPLQQYRRWLDAAQAGGLPPNTLRFALSAHERGWPVSVQHRMVHIGWGTERKTLDSSFTGQTSQIATHIARDKHITSRLLEQAGLPVPPSSRVRDWDSARKIAQTFGWPVVIKPAALDQGIGVVPGIRDEDTLRKAFEAGGPTQPGRCHCGETHCG